MYSLARDPLPRWRLLHFPLLALLGAYSMAIGVFTDREDYGRPNALLVPMIMYALPAAVPLFAACGGGRPRVVFLRSLVVMAIVAGLFVIVFGDARTASIGRAVTASLAGAAMAAMAFAFAFPLVGMVLRATARPRERNVAAETALLGAYGLFVTSISSATRLGDALCTGRIHRSLAPYCAAFGSLRYLPALTALATITVGLVGLAWEIRARRRVRVMLAGRVPGWIARPSDDVPGAASVPFLRWLGRPRRSLDARAPDETAVLLRMPSDPAAPAYRGNPDGAVPWVRVPPEVPHLSALLAFNAAIVLGAATLLRSAWPGLHR
jgi:hypothetical protein